MSGLEDDPSHPLCSQQRYLVIKGHNEFGCSVIRSAPLHVKSVSSVGGWKIKREKRLLLARLSVCTLCYASDTTHHPNIDSAAI
jgi:hypothetical protein